MEARTIMKQVLAQGDRVLKPAPGVTVLIYHRVGGGSGSEVDLDVDAFRAQLEHLREHHTVVSLDAAAEQLRVANGEEHTASTVVITFDDGTDDFCDHVVPALVEYETPATLYVATHFIDRGVPFPWGAPPASWQGLRDAADTGLVTIGSHTHTHVLLDRADATDPSDASSRSASADITDPSDSDGPSTGRSDSADPSDATNRSDTVDPAGTHGPSGPARASTIGDELDRSIELIGEHIGTPPAHFAYPKALPGSQAAEAEVRRRFTTAALARSRVNRPGHTDLHRLWRTPIQRSDGHDFFVAKAAGGLRLEGELRNLVAKVKYRGATT